MFISEEHRRFFDQFVGEVYQFGTYLNNKGDNTPKEEYFMKILDEYADRLVEMGELDVEA